MKALRDRCVERARDAVPVDAAAFHAAWEEVWCDLEEAVRRDDERMAAGYGGKAPAGELTGLAEWLPQSPDHDPGDEDRSAR